MRSLVAFTRSRPIGRIILDGGTLTGTTPGLADMAAVELRKAGGDAAAAFAALSTFTNGYLTLAEVPWPVVPRRGGPQATLTPGGGGRP